MEKKDEVYYCYNIPQYLGIDDIVENCCVLSEYRLVI